jgi:S-adenosylmethionine:tRNA ribosyltransferase-isomerase
VKLADFDYDLPEELIARHPAPDRRGSRLLVVDRDDGSLQDRQFAELPGLLRQGDLLVLNDTRVIKARLRGQKESGGRVEALVERVLDERRALAHVKASKSPKAGTALLIAGEVHAGVTARHGNLTELEFDRPVTEVMERFGDVPLPPYIDRPTEGDDERRYQTVYAHRPGAVAAPTAGLHFDGQMLDETLAAGVRHAHITLHVGAGTFQALRREHIEANRLHSERVRVSEACCEAVRNTRQAGGRVIAVGTTAVRALESASRSGEIRPFEGETDLFILPGYRFRSVDAMITNFHLPKSSLLMLVAAFAGRERILRAYEHAVQSEYRFFSYGDSMFVTPGADP